MPLYTVPSSATISKISKIGNSASVSVNYLCALLPLSSFRYHLLRLFVPLIATFEVKLCASSPLLLYWFDRSCAGTNQKKSCTFQPSHSIGAIFCTSRVNFSSVVVTRQERLLVVARAECQTEEWLAPILPVGARCHQCTQMHTVTPTPSVDAELVTTCGRTCG